jgi:hypothetical protein
LQNIFGLGLIILRVQKEVPFLSIKFSGKKKVFFINNSKNWEIIFMCVGNIMDRIMLFGTINSGD